MHIIVTKLVQTSIEVFIFKPKTVHLGGILDELPLISLTQHQVEQSLTKPMPEAILHELRIGVKPLEDGIKVNMIGISK